MKIEEIAKRLKQARTEAGYKTAKSFVEKFGISQSTYSLHETGKRSIGSQAAIYYCNLLGIDIDWLLTGKAHYSNVTNKQDPSTIFSDNKDVTTEIVGNSSTSLSHRLSDDDLQQMTLVTQTKHSDMQLKTIDRELLSEITREVMHVFNENVEKSDEIARAISVIYYNIEETTGDKAGKHLLIKPLLNAFKAAFDKTDDSTSELKVSNMS